MISNCQSEPVAQARVFARCHALIFRLAFFAALLAVIPRVHASTPLCEARALRSHEALRGESLANWEPLDDRTILVWTKHSARASLVRLSRPLDGLTSAPVITLVDGDGDRTISACGRDGLTLSYDESERARIVSITRLSARLTAALDARETAPKITLRRT